QQSPRVYRVGFLSPHMGAATSPGSYLDTFLNQLRDLGYAEGQNLELVIRLAHGKDERLSELATSLVALKPDVIVALTTPATLAAKQATATIPIVMLRVSDPAGSGFVASLAHPGGNVTGVGDLDSDLCVKSVE